MHRRTSLAATNATHAAGPAAAATHIDLIGKLSDSGAAEVVASIASAESRHCVVLADVLGSGNDLGMTLVNSAQPIEA